MVLAFSLAAGAALGALFTRYPVFWCGMPHPQRLLGNNLAAPLLVFGLQLTAPPRVMTAIGIRLQSLPRP